jgi:hypothetical protein
MRFVGQATAQDQETFKMKIQTRSAATLLILSAVVGACGGTSATVSPGAQGQASSPAQASAPADSSAPAQASAPAASSAGINACALITEQEATAFLGSDPGPGTDSSTAASPTCAYGAALTLSVDPSAGKAKFDTDKAAAQGSGKLQDLSGVGDAGYAFIVANTIAQMEILKGSALLTVNVQGDPSLQNITLAALTTLGTTAVGRL